MKAPAAHHYFGDAFTGADIRGSAERLVIVFQCYLDDSGTSGLPVVTMAGFVASLNQWEIVEPALDDILSGYEVPVLHAKEFHDQAASKNGARLRSEPSRNSFSRRSTEGCSVSA